jgi:hypothetical protein
MTYLKLFSLKYWLQIEAELHGFETYQEFTSAANKRQIKTAQTEAAQKHFVFTMFHVVVGCMFVLIGLFLGV